MKTLNEIRAFCNNNLGEDYVIDVPWAAIPQRRMNAFVHCYGKINKCRTTKQLKDHLSYKMKNAIAFKSQAEQDDLKILFDYITS